MRYGITQIPINNFILLSMYKAIHFFILTLAITFLGSCASSKKSISSHFESTTIELFKNQELDWVQPFCEGLALASKDGKKIIINEKGVKQFDFLFDYSDLKFNNGMAIVVKNNSYGMIDLKGNIVVEPIFKTIRTYSDSVVIVKKDRMFGIYDIASKEFNALSNSEVATRDHEHYTVTKNTFKGVVNNEGKTIIPFEYQAISTKNGNYFVAKKADKFGVVDRNNKIITPFEYDFIYMISVEDKSYFIASNDRRYGLLDTKGELKINCENTAIEYDLRGFIFLKKEASYVILDKDLNIHFEKEYEKLRPIGNGKYIAQDSIGMSALFDSKTGTIKPITQAPSGKFSSNKIIFKENDMYGILDSNMIVLTPPIYTKLKFVGPEFISAKNEEGTNLITKENNILLREYYEDLGWIHAGILTAKRNGKWGLINILGDSLTSFKYDRISKIRNSPLFNVTIGKENGIVDLEGNVIKELGPGKIKEEGNYLIVQEDAKYGLMMKNGKSVLPIDYDYITNLGLQHGSRFPNLFRITRGERRGIFNALLDEKVEFKYKQIDELREETIVVKKDSTFGLIDPYENQITPFEYEYLEDYANTPMIYASSLDYKVGLINRNGEVVIPLEYRTLKNYDQELISVKKGDLWGFVDKNGELVIPMRYKSVDGFKNNFCVIKDGKLQGLINKRGNTIIPLKYERIYPLGKSNYGFTLDQKYGAYDTTGVEVLAPIYDRISPFNLGNTIVKKDDKYGVYDTYGTEVMPIIFDEIKRKTFTKTVRNFNSTSRTGGPTEFYEVTYQEYKFTTDNNGNCTENCPPSNILERINKK